MFRSTIGYIIPVQFRYIPIIIALGLSIPLFAIEKAPDLTQVFLFFSVLGLFFLTSHKGFMLDTKTNEYKIYTGVFGLKLGTWQALPHLTQIYVYRGGAGFNSTVGLINYGSVSATAVFVVLYTQEEQKIPVAVAGGKVGALKIAEKLNKHLKTTICDHTGRERKYIEPVQTIN